MNPLLENYVCLKMDPRVKIWDGDYLRKIEEQIRKDPENAEAIANLYYRQKQLEKTYRFVSWHYFFTLSHRCMWPVAFCL